MRRLLIALSLALPGAALAQADVERFFFVNEANFWIALVAGVAIALAFHVVLTALSIAGGLSAFSLKPKGDGNDKRYESKHHDEAKSADASKEDLSGAESYQTETYRQDHPTSGHYTSSHSTSSATHDRDEITDEDDSSSLATVSGAIGLWGVVMSVIALFFASWLAVLLSQTWDPTAAIVLGLSIWAITFLILITIDANVTSSLIGSLAGVARSGMASAKQGLSALTSKSPETRAANAARKAVHEVVDQLHQDVDGKKMRKRIEEYVQELSPPDLEPKDFRKEMEKLLDRWEIRAVAEEEDILPEKHEFVATMKRDRAMDGDDAKQAYDKLKSGFAKLKDEYKNDKRNTDTLLDGIFRVAGVSEQEARQQREQFEKTLAEVDNDAADPEGIKADLEQLMKDPKGGGRALKQRAAELDQETVVQVIARQTGKPENEIRDKADKAMHLLQKVGIGTDGANSSGTGLASNNSSTSSAEKKEKLRRTVLGKLGPYIDSLNQPQLQSRLKHDIDTLFDDPKLGVELLYRHVKNLNRDELRSIIATTRPNMSEQDAEDLLTRLEDARRSAEVKYERAQNEIRYRVKQARDAAMLQADHLRKAAATAAWMIFFAAVLSGGAAVAGALIAV